MGSGEMDTPAKASKTSASQEQPPTSTAAVYHDWTAFQAYYNSGTTPIPPHGFFPPSVASSPQAHPYIWGAQHLIPQYGTPPQYVAMYPHGGLYAHPSMSPAPHPFSPFAMPSPSGNAEASGPVLGGAEVDGKSSDGKERSPLKRSKGSLGSLNMLTGRNNNQMGKSLGVSDEVFSQSGESGSEESSEGSDANSQNDSQQKACSGQDSLEAEAGQNGSAVCSSQNGISCTPPQTMLNQTMAIMSAPGGVAGPTTNLNIGMDYWGGPTPSPVPALRGKVPATPVAGAMVPSGLVGRENTQSELWLQDERELKRLRRKQSNRESARRSRLRKQAECEELAQRVEVLKEENNALRLEVSRSRKEYEQLLSQNSSLKERLGEDPRGHNGDPRLDDDRQRCLDSDVQPGKMDPAQSGH